MSALMLILALAAQAGDAPPRAYAADRLGAAPEAQLALHRFGQCVAERFGRTATNVLRQDFRTANYQRGMRSMLEDNRVCVARGQRAQFSGVLGAGAIAEGLLDADHGALLASLPDRAAIAPDQGFSPTDTAAICVVKRDVATVRALFGTEPASEDERRAIAALSAPLSQCLPTGQDFRFNRPGLRAILALSAFRIAAGVAPAKQG